MDKGKEGREAVGNQTLGETNHEQGGHHKHGEGRETDPHTSHPTHRGLALGT